MEPIVATPVFSDSLFSEPANDSPSVERDKRSASTLHAQPEITPVTLDVGGDELLTIVNFRGELPEPTSARTRSTFVRAAEAAGLLDEDGRHAVARALVQPDGAASLIKADLLATETMEATTLAHVQGPVWSTELWPLLQPRTAAESLKVDRPRITGALNSAGEPQAMLVLTFHDVQHLADYMYQTIIHTRHTGNDYTASILSRRVGRPVLAHVVRLEFEDGSQPFTVLAVRDGITRLVSAVAARLGRKPSPEDVAKRMIEDLLTTVPPRSGKAPDASQDHARGRERVAAELRARFAAGVASGEPTEDAIRIGQTFTLPAQTYVKVQATPTKMLPPGEIFPESMRAVLGSIHTEFRSWDPAAQAIDVGERALQRAQHAGYLDADVVKLAIGTRGHEHTSEVFGNDAIPNTALWRGVYLISALSQPPAFNGIKEQLRSLLGITNIWNKRFVGYLGPLIDVPWRSSKFRSLQQARRAWSGGGPIPFAFLGTDWEPVPTKDFLSLVPRALDGDANARRTLQVAGGIALVADRLLASNTGSALQVGDVPFRAAPNDITAKLGGRDNEAGLYQLAYAAQTFQSDKAAVNSFSDRDFKGEGLPAEVYVIPAIDPEEPSKVLMDGAGQPVQLTQFEVVRLSDPARANKEIAEAGAGAARAAGYEMPQSDGQLANQLRTKLGSGLKSIEDLLVRLLELHSADVGHPLGSREDWSDLSTRAQRISSRITVHEPPEENPIPDDLSDDDDDDTRDGE